MPQLIGLVIVGAGIWAGVKAIQLVAERFSATATSAPSEQDEGASARAGVVERDLGRLEADPRTGIYRPVDGTDRT